MAKAPREYRRLTFPATGVGSYKTLWLGTDHLLVVESNGYSEDCRKLLFRDIKGFFITESDRRLWWMLPWATVAFLSLAVALTDLLDGRWPGASGVLLLISAAAGTVNYFMGSGCLVYAATEVQIAKLPVFRRPKAARILGRLTPLIQAAQAGLAVSNTGTSAAPGGSESPPLPNPPSGP